MARSTASRLARLTCGAWLITRDAAVLDTPARSATSSSVGCRRGGSVAIGVRCSFRGRMQVSWGREAAAQVRQVYRGMLTPLFEHLTGSASGFFKITSGWPSAPRTCSHVDGVRLRCHDRPHRCLWIDVSMEALPEVR